ncbi:MAG: toxin [Candidatus Margulisbacteria bacterium]|nr:toxin [Candidatus Margulisiibacteriota bacterium]
MTNFIYSEEKNELLKIKRKISFEDIILCIEEKKVLDIVEHPNKDVYPGQYPLIIEYNNYAYYVPIVIKEEQIILKTIIPSRKFTKKYLKGDEANG